MSSPEYLDLAMPNRRYAPDAEDHARNLLPVLSGLSGALAGGLAGNALPAARYAGPVTAGLLGSLGVWGGFKLRDRLHDRAAAARRIEEEQARRQFLAEYGGSPDDVWDAPKLAEFRERLVAAVTEKLAALQAEEKTAGLGDRLRAAGRALVGPPGDVVHAPALADPSSKAMITHSPGSYVKEQLLKMPAVALYTLAGTTLSEVLRRTLLYKVLPPMPTQLTLTVQEEHAKNRKPKVVFRNAVVSDPTHGSETSDVVRGGGAA